MDHRGRHHRGIPGQYRAALRLERFDGGFAADPAARRGVEMALEPFVVHLDIRIKFDGYRVAGLPWIRAALGSANLMDLLEATENTLGEKESGGQFEIVTGSPHSERDGFRPNADFEGFFNGKQILHRIDRTVFDALDRYRQDAAGHSPRLLGSSVLRLFGSVTRRVPNSQSRGRKNRRTDELKNLLLRRG